MARNGGDFYSEYPVVISTTFSARRCLPYFSPGFLFDYVIMDEASQVDVATGALALSCAKNAVIVGDKMQLPNVVTTADRVRETQPATVDKFQGREKEVVVISTTDDNVTPFADDPNLLNVAVSRAKSKLYVVITGNELSGRSNIGDLLSYIEYNNFTMTQSRVNSIFDYLYGQYAAYRFEYVRHHGKVSVYDSENLMYGLLRSILEENDLAEYGIVFEEPLKELLSRRQIACLTDDERRYVLNDLTHVDFIIYNKTSKSPVLAVEVDGYRYHRPGSRQAMRDRMKDAILEKSGVKLLRFSTTGSGEKGKILAALGCI